MYWMMMTTNMFQLVVLGTVLLLFVCENDALAAKPKGKGEFAQQFLSITLLEYSDIIIQLSCSKHVITGNFHVFLHEYARVSEWLEFDAGFYLDSYQGYEITWKTACNHMFPVTCFKPNPSNPSNLNSCLNVRTLIFFKRILWHFFLMNSPKEFSIISTFLLNVTPFFNKLFKTKLITKLFLSQVNLISSERSKRRGYLNVPWFTFVHNYINFQQSTTIIMSFTDYQQNGKFAFSLCVVLTTANRIRQNESIYSQ